MRKEYAFLHGFLQAIAEGDEGIGPFDLQNAMEDCSDILAELTESNHQPSDGSYYDLGQACGDYATGYSNDLPDIFEPALQDFIKEKFAANHQHMIP